MCGVKKMSKSLKQILMVALIVSIAMVVIVGPVSADYYRINSGWSGEDVYSDGHYIGTAGDVAWVNTGWHFITSYFYDWLVTADWYYFWPGM